MAQIFEMSIFFVDGKASNEKEIIYMIEVCRMPNAVCHCRVALGKWEPNNSR